MSGALKISPHVKQVLFVCIILAVIIVPFLLFGAKIETSAKSWTASDAPSGVAASIFALLALDVLLPVPSSVISLIAGKVMGVIAGTALIWAGMTLGCYVGVLVGQGALAPLARLLRLELPEKSADAAATEWGWISLVLMRPIPVLAEASVLFAAARGVSSQRIMMITCLANIPIAFLYGYSGNKLLGDVPLWAMLVLLAILTAPAVIWQIRSTPRVTDG